MTKVFDTDVQRSAPSVSVCGDAVVIAAYGSLVTLMWKANPVMRLSVQAASKRAGAFVVMVFGPLAFRN